MRDVFTEAEFPNGLMCMGCGHTFTEGEKIFERPGDHPDVEVVGRMLTGQPVSVVELVCGGCNLATVVAGEPYVPLSVRYGGRRKKIAWWMKGVRERVALWLAPWLGGR